MSPGSTIAVKCNWKNNDFSNKFWGKSNYKRLTYCCLSTLSWDKSILTLQLHTSTLNCTFKKFGGLNPMLVSGGWRSQQNHMTE